MEIIKKIFMEKNQLFFILLYLHMVNNIFVWRVTYKKFSTRLFEKIGNSFLFLSGVVFIFTYISYYIPFFSYILIGILLFLCTCEIIYYFEYNSFFTSRVFIILKETNLKESREFLNDLMTIKLLKSLFIIIFILLIIPFFSSKLFNYCIEKFDLNNNYFLIFIAISILYLLKAIFSKNADRYFRYLLYYRIWKEFLEAKKQIKENTEALEAQLQKEKEINNLNLEREDINTIIFVIGESASRNYMELYGSYLKNSPYMKKREENGDLFLFNNVISPESITVLAIPKIMTFKNYENNNKWYNCTNIISILKKSGYKTYWISNQAKNEIGGKVCSALTDKYFFVENFTNQEENYDELLIEEGIKIIENEKKKAIFFHLQGSHNTYKKRYPAKWNIDNEKNIEGNFIDKRKRYIAEYSNSLRYTDYILEEIYKKFERQKTVLLYISDHAEELWESRDVRGHSPDNGSKYMIEIPMFMMISKSLQEKYPELVENCKNAINKPYMTDDIIHTILGMVGIKIEEYDEKRDIISNNFNTLRKRMYQGKDYDTFWKLQYNEKK